MEAEAELSISPFPSRRKKSKDDDIVCSRVGVFEFLEHVTNTTTLSVAAG
jgi:hypothetical protein